MVRRKQELPHSGEEDIVRLVPDGIASTSRSTSDRALSASQVTNRTIRNYNDNPSSSANLGETFDSPRNSPSTSSRVNVVNAPTLRRPDILDGTPEKKRRSDADRQRDSRNSQTPQRRQQNREQNAEQHRDARNLLDPAERQRIRYQDAEQHRDARNSLTPEERQQIQLQNAEQHRAARNSLAPEERQQIREQNAEQHRDARARRNSLFAAAVDSTVPLEPVNLGPMSYRCRCGAAFFRFEAESQKAGFRLSGGYYHKCCNNGKVPHNTYFDDYPELLLQKLNSPSFSRHLRSSNSAVAFASHSAEEVQFRSRGPPIYKIQGMIQRRITGTAAPREDVAPKFAQLYFVDMQEATEAISLRLPSVPLAFIEEFHQWLLANNSIANRLQTMREVEQQIAADTGEVPDLRLFFVQPSNTRPQPNLPVPMPQVNVPRADQVGLIFMGGSDEELPNYRVVVSNRRGNQLSYVDSLDPLLDAYLYPWINPHGRFGWCPEYMGNDGRKVSRRAYIANQIAHRPDIPSPLMKMKKLYQQYLVDNWYRVEHDDLEFIRRNQQKIRVDLYSSLINVAQRIGDARGERPGTVVILPATVVGSERWLQQQYYDAMCIVRRYHIPDLFITMTTNPNWPEITANLGPNETPNDRPDIVVRVFDGYLKKFFTRITKDWVFGEVVGYFASVEFQQRDLPHVHAVFILREEHRIRTAAQVDRFISAEIPDRSDPEGRRIVGSLNFHGKCDENVAVARCYDPRTGRCKRLFPKPFQEFTVIEPGAYPLYRRRDDGNVFRRTDTEVYNNQSVVPYNMRLSKEFNAHINVESVQGAQCIQYLVKYAYKGGNHCNIRIEDRDRHDEVARYEKVQNIGPMFAAHRINKLPLCYKSHSVERLPVHLPGRQIITIPEDGNAAEMEAALSKSSKLMDFFALNARDDSARNLPYDRIPEEYVWVPYDENGRLRPGTSTGARTPKKYRWERRQRGHEKKLGRIHVIGPREGDLFFLRLLLLHRSGATSYEDLRTINGRLYETFREACSALGIAGDDNEWRQCLMEAAFLHRPARLRQLFAIILANCECAEPEQLFSDFADAFSEDYRHRRPGLPDERLHAMAYAAIERLLQRDGLSFAHFSMASAENMTDDLDQLDAAEQTLQYHRQYEMLNQDQKIAVDAIINSFHSPTVSFHSPTLHSPTANRLFFLDGPAGSGKTTTLKCICSYLASQRKTAVCVAFTGIAAHLLPNGQTVHSAFRLPLELTAQSSSGLKPHLNEWNAIKNASIIIWDEISMTPKAITEIVDRTMRTICDNDVPFGGKIILFSGDFRQCPPVKVGAGRQEIVAISMKNWTLWPNVVPLRLRQNMRAPDQEFANYLLDIGSGRATNASTDSVVLPSQCLAQTDLIDEIIAPIISEERFDDLAHSAILAPHHQTLRSYNERALNLLDATTEYEYLSWDSVKVESSTSNLHVPVEFLNTLEQNNFPSHRLRLRRNAVVMVLRNLSLSSGLCNGTRLLILQTHQSLIHARILTGIRSGEDVFIPRIKLTQEIRGVCNLERRQFPVQVAFTITINKAQGQSFKRVGVCLQNPVFTHGQLYVAASRAVSAEGLRFDTTDPTTSTRNNTAVNVVYEELIDATGLHYILHFLLYFCGPTAPLPYPLFATIIPVPIYSLLPQNSCRLYY